MAMQERGGGREQGSTPVERRGGGSTEEGSGKVGMGGKGKRGGGGRGGGEG